jgi:hypothetical protein
MNLRLSIFGVGTYQLSRKSPYEKGFPVYSGAFICPVCLHRWAELAVEGEFLWELRAVHCIEHTAGLHPDINPVPGSIIDNFTTGGYDGGLLDILPDALVQREFELHLRAYEVIASCQMNHPFSPALISSSKVLPEQVKPTPLLPSLSPV